MVGTSTRLCPGSRAARNSAAVLIICMTAIRSEAVERVVGKSSALYVGYILAHGELDTGAAIHKVAHEPQRLAPRQSQHVMQHQDLAAAADAGADADDGNRE